MKDFLRDAFLFACGAVWVLGVLTLFTTTIPAGTQDTDGYVLKKTWHCF